MAELSPFAPRLLFSLPRASALITVHSFDGSLHYCLRAIQVYYHILMMIFIIFDILSDDAKRDIIIISFDYFHALRFDDAIIFLCAILLAQHVFHFLLLFSHTDRCLPSPSH